MSDSFFHKDEVSAKWGQLQVHHLRVAEHARPLGEVQVGRDHHAGVLVQPTQQMEQQGAAGLAERQVAELSHFLIVLRDRLVSLEISLIDFPSRILMPRILPIKAMVITSSPLPQK
jgi:hypothetical protein